jgi:hypothetical protein
LRFDLELPKHDSVREKNYNSGGVVAEESGKYARTAHVTAYLEART